MDIGRISQNFNRTSSIQGTGTANPLIQRDSFTKSGVSDSIDGTTDITGITPQYASNILFSDKKMSDLIDPFNLKSEDLQAWSATSDPETGGYFAGLVEGKNGDGRCFISSFNSDGSIKWKVPVEEQVYNLTPNKKGGVIARHWNRIFNYDKNGTKTWDFALPGTDHSFDAIPVKGPDDTIYYSTGIQDLKKHKTFMSIVAVKDGKLLWNYDCENHFNHAAGIMVTKKGDVFFMSDGEKRPENLLEKLFPNDKKSFFLICLNPDGTKKYEKEVITNDFINTRAIEGSNGNIFYLADKSKSLNAITPDGESLWKFSQERISHPPVADGKGNIYITTGSKMALHEPPRSSIICIDEKTGEKKWERNFERTIEAEPILTDNGITLKVSKSCDPRDKPGFIQLSETGTDMGFLREIGRDNDGLVYLEKNNVVTRTLKKYSIRHFNDLGKIKLQNVQELDVANTGREGTIEVKEKSVVIGGVTLKRGKFSGIFGHWI